MDERGKWLASLKPGDEVFVTSGSYGRSIERVERLTKTRAIVGHHQYYLSDGRRYGDSGSWGWGRIHPLTPEIREEVETKTLREKMQSLVMWNEIPLNKLRAIDAILRAPDNTEPQP